jgi:serine/threonine-protein kinase
MFFMVGIRSRCLTSSLGLAFAGVVFTPQAAVAQSADTAAAESLFEQGRDLLRAGKAAEACPKLAESERIEPSTGTLLALAMCHEAEGKLASAWAEFVSVEARARGENRVDRQQAAHDKAQALRPRLSTLEVRIPNDVAALPGLEIRRDGEVLGRGAWNVAVPTDGAEHAVEAKATGKKPWKGSITVKAESDAAVLAVPALLALPRQESKAEPSGQQEAKTKTKLGMRRELALAAAGVGVIGVGVGAVFGFLSESKHSDAAQYCNGEACSDQRGVDDGSRARTYGDISTVAMIIGGVGLAAGATLWFTAPKRNDVPSAQVGMGFSTLLVKGAF